MNPDCIELKSVNSRIYYQLECKSFQMIEVIYELIFRITVQTLSAAIL